MGDEDLHATTKEGQPAVSTENKDEYRKGKGVADIEINEFWNDFKGWKSSKWNKKSVKKAENPEVRSASDEESSENDEIANDVH